MSIPKELRNILASIDRERIEYEREVERIEKEYAKKDQERILKYEGGYSI